MKNYKSLLLLVLSLVMLAGPAAAVNHPPILEPAGTKEAVFGQTLTFYLHASDPDGHPVFYWANNLPANAMFYPDTGFFRWSPRLDQLGDYDFEFGASDEGDPPLTTSESVTVRVVYRTVEREKKAFGFLAKEKVVAEARTLHELYPRVTNIFVNGIAASLEGKKLEVDSLPTIEVEVSSPFRVDPASLTITLNDSPVGVSSFYDVKTIGGQDNIISLRFKVDQLRFAAGQSYNLSVRAANELGGTRGSWQLVVP